MLGLRFCARASSSCGKRGPLFIAVRGPPAIAASLVADHGLQTRRLSSCGLRALLLRGMWDLHRPGLEPVSPALAGRFSTTAPPGKPTVPPGKPPLSYSLERCWTWVISAHTCLCICPGHLIGSMESQWIFGGVSWCAIIDCNENSEKRHCGNVGEWNSILKIKLSDNSFC